MQADQYTLWGTPVQRGGPGPWIRRALDGFGAHRLSHRPDRFFVTLCIAPRSLLHSMEPQ